MTHRTDCSVKPGEREFVDRLAECYYDATQQVKRNGTIVAAVGGSADTAEQITRDAGGRPVATYEGTTHTVVVVGSAHQSAVVDNVEAHPQVADIAERGKGFSEDIGPTERLCNYIARDKRMEWAGSGAARATFKAVPDPMDPGDLDSVVTPFTECVLKVARSGSGLTDGIEQNEEEITNWESLPDDIKGDVDNKGPIFNPLVDYDEDNKWITQPWCPPPGNVGEVMRRVKDRGYRIGDVAGRPDNVGTYPDHGGSAIIDYGFSLTGGPETFTDVFDTITDGLSPLPLTDVVADTAGGEPVVTFKTNDLPGTTPTRTHSFIHIDRQGNIDEMEFNFPLWSRNRYDRTEILSEMSLAFTVPSHPGLRYDTNVRGTVNGIRPRLLVTHEVGYDISPDDAVTETERVVEHYQETFSNLS